jgi:RNA polymerase sigma-70 factor (ECF subfamily)
MALYSLLTHIDSSPVVALSRAIARRFVDGPAAALADVDGLSGELGEYHLFHATRAALLRDLGRSDEAAREDAAALALTRNTGERALLEERLARNCGS